MAKKKANRRKKRATTTTTTEDVPTVEVKKSRCQACQSTKRHRYIRVSAVPFTGFDADENPVTHIVRRWCRCASKGCSQLRIDRSLEYHPDGFKQDLEEEA